MASPQAMVLPAVDNTLGADFIGTVLAAALWGVSTIQAYWYFLHYPKDMVAIKVLVAFVWIFDTLHQIFISHTVYLYTISHYANPAYLINLVFSLVWQVLFASIVALLVQGFLTLRIYRLSQKNIFVTAGAVALVAANFVVSMVFFGKTVHFKRVTEAPAVKGLSQAVNALGAAGDIYIAIALCYLLASRRTGFQRSDNIITRMIMFTVNTGLLTSLCAVLSFIMITTLPNTFLYQTFYFVLSRLYANSLLATLNVRRSYSLDSNSAQQMTTSHAHDGNRPLKMMPLGSRARPTAQPNGGGVAIQIQTVQERDGDFMDYDLEAKRVPDSEDSNDLPYDGSTLHSKPSSFLSH